MECNNNCQSLFSMIKALNENISSLLTGYGLLLNVVIDHEDQICQLRENHIENSHECSDEVMSMKIVQKLILLQIVKFLLLIT